MDADYSRNLAEDGTFVADFEHALFVYTTVMSRPTADRAIVDAGLKAVSIDSGMPVVTKRSDLEYVKAADEHGTIRIGEPDRGVELGDRLALVPGHCDPTVNLHDWYVVVRQNTVQAVWPVEARGALS
jgi:3-hydroxy-D-aspartate aldolase